MAGEYFLLTYKCVIRIDFPSKNPTFSFFFLNLGKYITQNLPIVSALIANCSPLSNLLFQEKVSFTVAMKQMYIEENEAIVMSTWVNSAQSQQIVSRHVYKTFLLSS